MNIIKIIITALFGTFLIPSLIANDKAESIKELPDRKPSDSKLFRKVNPEKSGISLILPIDKSHPLKRIYVSAFACGGASSGDVNNDGLTDVFIANGPGPNKIYINKGNWIFEDNTIKANLTGGQNWTAGAPLVDIDGDGDLDIYACNYGTPNQLFINDGKGLFVDKAQQFGLDINGAILNAAFADYDNDGDLDAYLLGHRFYRNGGKPEKPPTVLKNGTYQVLPNFSKYFQVNLNSTNGFKLDTAGSRDYLMINDNGVFRDVTIEAGINSKPWQGNSVTWWDFNNDGHQDIYIANDFEGQDFLYRNNGNGTFSDITKQYLPHVPWFSMGADSADINNDGLLDLFVVDMAGTTHYKSKTSMGTMGANNQFMLTADPPQHMRNCMFVNTGKANRFLDTAFLSKLSSTDWSWSVKLSDFDEDGLVDAFVTNGISRNFNNSDNPITKEELIEKTEWSIYENLPSRPEENLCFKNMGDLKFKETSKLWGLDELSMAYGASKADLDSDGDLDLIITNLDKPVSVYENLANGNRITLRLKSKSKNSIAIGARVKLKTKNGIQIRENHTQRGFSSTDDNLIHFGLGDTTKVDFLEIHWPNGSITRTDDIAANHHYTFLEPENSIKKITISDNVKPTLFVKSEHTRDISNHWEQPFPDFKLQPLLPNKLSQLGPGLARGDVDNDGDEDLFLGGSTGSIGRLLLNDGKGRLKEIPFTPAISEAGSEDMGALFFEANGDGNLDLYVVSGSVEAPPEHTRYKDRLYLGNGKGQFTKSQTQLVPNIYNSGSSISACDFDRDGDLDLYIGGRSVPGKYPITPKSVLLENDGSGKFKDITLKASNSLSKSGLVTSSIWTDINSDNWQDLIITHEWGPVSIYLNNQGKLMETSFGKTKLTGWWNGIESLDIDNDGDFDLIVTNFGLNTKYKASIDQPELLFYGDFDRDGDEEILEAKFENGQCLPHRGFSCSSNAMPFLKEKMKTFHNFATASLAELYTSNRIDTSIKLEANTLTTGVFINNSTKEKLDFTFKPLPNLAQLSPSFGIIAEDINSDGNVDIFLAQNFYSPQIETRPMDNALSLVLIGDGDGDFTPLNPEESGIVLPGDSKAASWGDLDNDGFDEILITTNDGPVHSYSVNSFKKTVQNIKLKLKGSPNNPNAIGAKVIIGYEKNKIFTRTIKSSGGYLSQSSNLINIPKSLSGKKISIIWPDSKETNSIVPKNKDSFVISY